MTNRKQSYFIKIGSSLPKVIDKNIKKKNFIEISLINNWEKIIENDITRFCYPEKIIFSGTDNSGGTIILKTKRGRSMEIEFKSEEIIEKINQYFGYKAIKKISILQDFNQTNEKTKKITKKQPSKFNQKKIINKIKNNNLKNALQRLNKTLFDLSIPLRI